MKIMGILNVTPDSFSDGGKYVDIDKAVAHAKQMVANGADIIDIGGESTRPGASKISAEAELWRVLPVISALKEVVDVPLSIDTYKSEVAKRAIEAGASMINDVTGALGDPKMANIMAQTGAKVVLMHHTPHGEEEQITDILSTVTESLQTSTDHALAAGVKKENIILDPGIGFGKTYEQNILLTKEIANLKQTLGYPMLLGVSKKRMVRELVGSTIDHELEVGTGVITCFAYFQGVDIIRVHDVRGNRIAINVMKGLE